MPKICEFSGMLCAAALALPAMLMPIAVHADSAIDALIDGKVSGNLRLRYESVDVRSATIEDASALTLRTRLGYETAPFYGFTAMLELEDTHIVGGQDEYSPASIDHTKAASAVPATAKNPYTYAPIVDPEQTEINRAYLRYRGISKLDMSLGRQRILLDNQRFVGNVGWRQNEQTFDAFTAKYDGVSDWSFYYAYIDRVEGISGEKYIYNFDVDSSDNLFNITYSGFTLGKITAYGYFLNNQEPNAELINSVGTYFNRLNPALRYKSNETLGLRFDGLYILPTTMPLRLFYTAEYAKQELVTETATTEPKFDTDYSLFEGGVGYASKLGMLSAKVARSVMGSDHFGAVTTRAGFQTPYATKHAFNGWADMYLNTPGTGLEDKYATLAADLTPYGVKLMALYHKFSEVDGSTATIGARNLGSEWDLQALKAFGPKFTLGVKYANYSANSEAKAIATNIDTKKFWLWGEYAF